MKRALSLAFALCAASLLSWMGWWAVPFVLGAAIAGLWVAPFRRSLGLGSLLTMTGIVGFLAALVMVPILALRDIEMFAGMVLVGPILGATLGALGALPLAPIVFAAELAPGGPLAHGATIRRTLMTAALMGLLPGFALQLAAEQPHVGVWLALHAPVIAVCAIGDLRSWVQLRRWPPDPPAAFSYRESPLFVPSVSEDPSRVARVLSRQLAFDAAVVAVLAFDAGTLMFLQ
jgi:hypothetical protein